MTKKLTRSNDRVWAGVCGGIAEYLDFDPVLVRIAYSLQRIDLLHRAVDCDARKKSLGKVKTTEAEWQSSATYLS